MVFNWKNRGIISIIALVIFGLLHVGLPSSGANVKNVRNNSYKVSAVEKTNQNTTNNINEQNVINDAQARQLYAIVNNIGNKIIRVTNIPSSRNVQFSVVNKNEANAYTDNNYNVVVYVGILKYIEKEDELAFILAHELGHVEQKHVKKGTLRSAGIILVSNILNSLYPGSGTLTSISGKMANKKFSRKDEFKADERGIDFLVNAGYNPLSAISVLYKIGSNYTDFWSDHPSTEKRIYTDYKYIEENYPNYLNNGFSSQAYMYALNQIAKMDLKKQGKVKTKSIKSEDEKDCSEE